MSRPLKIQDRLSACPGCSLLCDDFQNPAQRDERLCQLGRDYFQQLASRPQGTRYWMGRKEVSPQQAIDRAQDILQQAHAPLVSGLEWLGVQTQALAVKVAQHYRGFVDTGFHRPMGRLLAFQQTGNVSATLGEIRDRAGLVVFLYADPQRSHPRLQERLNCDRKQVAWIGDAAACRNESSALQFSAPEMQAGNVAIWLHRFALQGVAKDETISDEPPMGRDEWARLVSLLQSHAHIGIIADDPGGLPLPVQQTYWSRLFRSVQAMNQQRRVWLLALRNDANGLGAENTISSLTGFPRAVSFQSGYPEFEATSFSADQVIQRGMADAILAIDGSHRDNPFRFSGPKIEIHSRGEPGPSTGDGDVTITTPFPEAGDWVRMDDVCLPVSRDVTRCPVADFFRGLLGLEADR